MSGSVRNSPPTRGQLPLGLLGMLALLAAGEAFVKLHEPTSFTLGTAASWKQSVRASGREAARCELLCLGDSMIKFGLGPRILREQTGLSAYNLAPWGGPPPVSYFQLRRALAAGARPRAIVFDCNPHLLMESTQFFARSWQEFATPAEALDLARATGDPAFFAQILLGRALPSMRARCEIRANLLTALQGGSYTGRLDDTLKPLVRNWQLNRGNQLHPPNVPPFDGHVNPQDDAMFPPHWAFNGASAAYFQRFLDLAAGHHIRLFWLLPPLSPATQQRREQLGIDARFTRLVKRVQAQYPGIVVIDARHAGFTDAVFLDHCHLDRHGTAALSVAVAKVLNSNLERPDAGARWVSLPPDAGAPIEAPGEDLIQSSIAVRERDARPRR